MRAAILIAGLALCAGCAPAAYEAEPTSSYQWQRRQEAIVRKEADRQRRCGTLRRGSEQFARECSNGRFISQDREQCSGSAVVLHETVLEKYPDGTCAVSWSVY